MAMKKTKSDRQIAALKGVITRLKKGQRVTAIAETLDIKEITVRFGGVIRTGSYENRRVSYEITSNCPSGMDPQVVSDYLEALVSNQFYQAQIKAIDGLPPEERDEVNYSDLTPQQAAEQISAFMRDYNLKTRLSPEKREARIKELDKKLRKLSEKIRKTKDLEKRVPLIEEQRTIKTELSKLRKGKR